MSEHSETLCVKVLKLCISLKDSSSHLFIFQSLAHRKPILELTGVCLFASIKLSLIIKRPTLQTRHVDATLKQRGNNGSHVF